MFRNVKTKSREQGSKATNQHQLTVIPTKYHCRETDFPTTITTTTDHQ